MKPTVPTRESPVWWREQIRRLNKNPQRLMIMSFRLNYIQNHAMGGIPWIRRWAVVTADSCQLLHHAKPNQTMHDDALGEKKKKM
jgi:hypothetical protein